MSQLCYAGARPRLLEAPAFAGHNPRPVIEVASSILPLPVLPEAGSRAQWPGLPGAAAALAIAEAAMRHAGLVLAVTAGEQHAYRLEEELRFFLGGRRPVTHFPDNETLPYDPFSPHQEILSGRLAALHQLPSQQRGVVIVTAATLLERMPPRAWLDGRALMLHAGEKLDAPAFRARLVAAGYQSVSEVQTQGEFAVRGALIDVFPMGSEYAYRLDLFDEEVESIRRFDPETQRSTDKVQEIRLLPAREFPTDKEGIETFRGRYRQYFPGDPARSRIYAEVSKSLMPGGIEAYLPLFFPENGTETLFDYLPAGSLVVEADDAEAALAAEWKQIQERHERYSGNIERPLMHPKDLFLKPELARSAWVRWLGACNFWAYPPPPDPLPQGEGERKSARVIETVAGGAEAIKAPALFDTRSRPVRRRIRRAPRGGARLAQTVGHPGARPRVLAGIRRRPQPLRAGARPLAGRFPHSRGEPDADRRAPRKSSASARRCPCASAARCAIRKPSCAILNDLGSPARRSCTWS